jgi:mannose-1-phosphate guanylyltransferase
MATPSTDTYIVMLAGGSGTRLWPSSRTNRPKQFAKILGTKTLFQETLERIKDFIPLSQVIIITNKEYVDDIKLQAPQIIDKNIIAEPEKKNTALAMGVAAAYVYHQNPNAIIINLATDHLIGNLDIYKNTLLAAAEFVKATNNLCTVGIVPNRPHTGFEYIKLGDQFMTVRDQTVYKIDQFITRPEKTDPENPVAKAQTYLDSGKYLWNANNFVWKARVILEEFARLAPDIYKNIRTIYDAIDTPQELQVLEQEYHQAREDQIDFAIGTKTDKLYVLKGEFSWNDLGGWKVVHELSKKDEYGNAIMTHGVSGQVISVDTTNCLIQTEDQLIATLGVDNLCIIDTKDALLICHKDRAEEIKKIIEIMKEKKLNGYL